MLAPTLPTVTVAVVAGLAAGSPWWTSAGREAVLVVSAAALWSGTAALVGALSNWSWVRRR